ncbi:MAG: DEAD/DEAH box helicase, partial [Bifidobacteriaceae bacterium]|nr:DEAD/DEAH box helicase [Bifidobacteriaceae bacterium]
MTLQATFALPTTPPAAQPMPNADDARQPETGSAFADLDLPEHLLRAVVRLGFASPTEIQAAAIPPLLAGRDVLGTAQTGTGKTAAFALPLLNAIDPGLAVTQALVLAPTRELAMQVAAAIEDFAATTRGLRVLPIYGGAPFGPQLKGLAAGAHVVVGTPGRVIDHLRRGRLDLGAVRFLVLDEADEMLRMGFAEDVETICSAVPATRQTALFSATMPPAIRRTADAQLTEPVRIEVTRPAATVAELTQRYAIVPYRHKTEALARVLASSDAGGAIVFVRTKSAVEEVAGALIERGFGAAGISGDVPQRERGRIIERMRAGSTEVLVATDVAARGLDIEGIGLVVNFDLPHETEGYVHRVGRTGRAGRGGQAMSFVTPAERARLRSIEKAIGTRIEPVAIPSAEQVESGRVAAVLERAAGRGRDGAAREAIEDAVVAGADPVELAAALLALTADDAGARLDVEAGREMDRELARLSRKEKGAREAGAEEAGRGGKPRRGAKAGFG